MNNNSNINYKTICSCNLNTAIVNVLYLMKTVHFASFVAKNNIYLVPDLLKHLHILLKYVLHKNRSIFFLIKAKLLLIIY